MLMLILQHSWCRMMFIMRRINNGFTEIKENILYYSQARYSWYKNLKSLLRREAILIHHFCRMRGSSSVLRIPVPDELHNSLNTRTLPIWANVNTRNHCSILVHKIRCIYLQDYSLLKLVKI
uniref:uncharacterized protein LOC127067962 n=1 Tax=Vespula vulgaris TaxID=7454 RepID=UPI00223ACD30|nr:uncharacterized protein LOC127067962 [Vespula vulgaris]